MHALRGKRVKLVFFVIISAGLFIGAFVPALVDMAKDGQLQGSLIVVGAMVMSWLIIAPWFVLSASRFVSSWLAAFISVPLFLFFLESEGETKGWFLPLGLPSSTMGLTVIGVIAWVWMRSRLRPLYALSVTVLLMALLSYGESLLARPFLPNDPYLSVRQLVSFILLSVALFFGLVAVLVHGLRAFRDTPQ